MNDEKALDEEVAKVDVVISLIPYAFHAQVIKSAIREKKNVVTTSYVSPAMLELEEDVKRAGITVMNEIGLGRYHFRSLFVARTVNQLIFLQIRALIICVGICAEYVLSTQMLTVSDAVKTIDDVHKEGGKIKSFLSYCGGLPAPEASDNPLGYKFSWSSRGVLLALRNAAKYYKDGKIEEISGPQLMGTAKPYFIYPGFAFVAYPNRDSTPYKERYNIPEAQTILRGTLRYQGFPEFVRVLVDMGFLSDEKLDVLEKPIPWKEATAKVLKSSSDSTPCVLTSPSSLW